MQSTGTGLRVPSTIVHRNKRATTYLTPRSYYSSSSSCASIVTTNAETELPFYRAVFLVARPESFRMIFTKKRDG